MRTVIVDSIFAVQRHMQNAGCSSCGRARGDSPGDILLRPNAVAATSSVFGITGNEIHLRHDVYPRNLQVDHCRHRAENPAVYRKAQSQNYRLVSSDYFGIYFGRTDLKNLYLSSMNCDSIK